MTKIEKKTLTGERALFATHSTYISECVFRDGESPLKESAELSIDRSRFSWKYPLWYCRDVKVTDTVLDITARSGIWYTHGIEMTGCEINAPKTFRRSSGIVLRSCRIPNAEETLWSCRGVDLSDVTVVGDYFGMNCTDVCADNLKVEGNYVFDGAENVTVKNSRLISKDSFWNCKNVTVENCYIDGEYIGWNSENITFINCTITSNQGLCYIKNLVMRNCKLPSTDLAFEYSTVDAEISSHVDSVKNPTSGRIVAQSIGEIIHEEERVDVSATVITVGGKNE